MMRSLVVALTLLSTPSFAHDIYTGLTGKLPGGASISCCNDRDCLAVSYRVVDGGAEFNTPYGPVFVEEWRIQYRLLDNDTSKDQAHWCGVRSAVDSSIITFCAILPPKSM